MVKLLLVIHVLGGSAALVSMVVPMVSRKGGALHRRAGRIFVAGMTIVSVTALMLAVTRALLDPSPSGRQAGIFLSYVALVTGAGVSAGIRVLHAKRRTGPHRNVWDLSLAAVLVAASVAMGFYGAVIGSSLFVAIPLVGFTIGGGQLAYWLRSPSHPMHWWFEHMSSMLGSAIAAVTAFLVVNADRVGLPSTSIIVWLAPTLIGTPGIAIWTAYYRRRFSGPAPRHLGLTVGSRGSRFRPEVDSSDASVLIGR